MTALRAHRKSSPGDDPSMPVELIEVISLSKAHEGQGLQHKQKVMKVEKMMNGRTGHEGRTDYERREGQQDQDLSWRTKKPQHFQP